MKKLRAAVAFVLLFLLICSSSLTILSELQPSRVSAQQAGPEALCVPPTTTATKANGDSAGLLHTGWLKLEVLNRATIRIVLSPEGFTCVTPAGLSMTYYAGSDGSGQFKTLFESTLIDRDTSDSNWEYVNIVQTGDAVGDESNLDGFTVNSFLSTEDPFNGGDSSVDIQNGFLEAINFADLVLSVEEDLIEELECSDGTNLNFFLREVDGSLEWRCTASRSSSILGLKGVVVSRDDIVNAENFNITYAISEDGERIEHVSPSEKDTRTFTWCSSGQFRTNCNATSDYLYIEGATPESLKEQASSINIPLTIKKEGSTDSISVIAAGSGTESGNDPTDPGGGAVIQPSCESNGGVFSFIFCPILSWLDEGIGWIDDRILNMLSVNEAYYSEDTNPGIKRTWGIVRNIAYALLIPIMLVMVISTAMGFGLFDAYTVKRALPRMLAAIVFMALSFDVAVILIEMSNAIGRSVGGLIAAPFGGVEQLQLSNIFSAPDDAGSTLLYGGALIAVGATLVSTVTIGFMVSILGVSLLALFVVFSLLIFREMLVIFLIILGPLAILSWIFPGNNKLWKMWWDSFSKLLLLFPIIAAILMSGRVFASIVDSTPTDENEVVVTVIKLIAFIGPYFFIPKAFQSAGAAFASIAGMAQNRQKGFRENQRKKRAALSAEARQKNKAYSRFSDNNRFGRAANTLLGTGSNLYALKNGRGGLQQRRLAGQALYGAEALKNDRIYQANQNDDNFLLALANRQLAEERLAAARSKLASASTAEERDAAQAEINARQNGLNAASQVSSRGTVATRRTALNALAKTGYQLSAGEQGYKELASTAKELSGNDPGAYASMMNEAQYHLKNAGRFDLGGINNGNGYDYDAGVDKANGYTAGNAKKETFIAGAQKLAGADYSGKGKIKTKDPTTGQVQEKDFGQVLAEGLAAGTISGDDVVLQHARLYDARIGATGGNKAEIEAQISAMESLFSSSVTAASPKAAAEMQAALQGMDATKARMSQSLDPAILAQLQNK